MKTRLIAILFALTGGILLGVVLGVVTDSNRGSQEANATSQQRAAGAAENWDRAAFERVMNRTVARAEATYPGEVRVAVMAPGWPEPVGVKDGDPAPMWGTVDPITALTLMRVAGTVRVPGPSRLAMVDSSECGQLVAVDRLQRRSGGQEQTIQAVEETLRESGAALRNVDDESLLGTEGSEAIDCDGFPVDPGFTQSELPRLGNAQWSISDASRFTQALGEGTKGPYGNSGQAVRDVLRQAKVPSTGLGFGRYLPASKTGWGGADADFSAMQITALDVGGQSLGVAVFYRPENQEGGESVGHREEFPAIAMVMRGLLPMLRKSQTKNMSPTTEEAGSIEEMSTPDETAPPEEVATPDPQTS